MKQIYRRLIVIFFFLIFFAIAPLIVLYATGYRYDFIRKKIQKTGIIVLKSTPKQASILIDGKKTKYTTDAIIKNLLPDTYDVYVQKKGYFPWYRSITVEPNKTAFAENIILFKNELPTIASANIFATKAAPDGNHLLLWKQENNIMSVTVYRPSDGTEMQLVPVVNKETQSLYWVDSQTVLIITRGTSRDTGMTLYKLDSANNPIAKRIITEISTDKIVHHNNSFFSIANNTLYELSIHSQNDIDLVPRFTAPKPLLAAKIMNDTVYYIAQDDRGNNLLYSSLLTTNQNPVNKTITKIPASNNISFIDDSEFVIIADKDNHLILLVDPIEERVIDTLYDARDIQWNSNHSEFLYHTEFEAWLVRKTQVYDEIGNKPFIALERELITRLGKEIKQIAWHPSNDYIFFRFDNSIHITEANSIKKTSFIRLISAESITDFYIHNNQLYFIGKIGQQSGLWVENL